MQCPSSHLTGMGMYDPVNHAAMWSESFKGDDLMNTCPSTALEVIIKFDNPVSVLEFNLILLLTVTN